MDEKLPLSGKRWLWVLAAIVVVIVLATIIGRQPASYNVPMGSPPSEAGTDATGASPSYAPPSPQVT